MSLRESSVKVKLSLAQTASRMPIGLDTPQLELRRLKKWVIVMTKPTEDSIELNPEQTRELAQALIDKYMPHADNVHF